MSLHRICCCGGDCGYSFTPGDDCDECVGTTPAQIEIEIFDVPVGDCIVCDPNVGSVKVTGGSMVSGGFFAGTITVDQDESSPCEYSYSASGLLEVTFYDTADCTGTPYIVLDTITVTVVMFPGLGLIVGEIRMSGSAGGLDFEVNVADFAWAPSPSCCPERDLSADNANTEDCDNTTSTITHTIEGGYALLNFV